MFLKFKKLSALVAAVCAVFMMASAASAQRDTVQKKRLYPPAATERGLIGGESHDSYVIRARRGQKMTVSISWKREEDNQASFTVSGGASFFNAESVKFGRETNGGKIRTGKIPATRDYYIYVVAHPIAQYTLRVTVK